MPCGVDYRRAFGLGGGIFSCLLVQWHYHSRQQECTALVIKILESG